MALAEFLVSLLTIICIYSVFGLGLNLKFGSTGLIDFGHVAYFMVGAYVTVVLTMPPGGSSNYQGIGGLGLPDVLGAVMPLGDVLGWLLGLVGGMVAAALVSLLVGVPTLRLREDYLAITALGIATILNALFHNERWLFNGAFGVRGVHAPAEGVFPIGLGSYTLNLGVFGAISLLVLAYGLYRLVPYVRPIEARSAGLTTLSAVTVLVAFFVLTRGGLLLVPGVVLLGVTAVIAQRALRASDRLEPVIVLAAIEVFVAAYVVYPFLTNGPTDVVLNLLWLFDPGAGQAGGLDYNRFFLLATASFLALSYWWVERTVNSPYGRVIRSIREDEDVAKALGRRSVRYKNQVLMFGSALAGAAGGLWAVHIGFIDTGQFGPLITFYAFAAVIIGGTANNRGVILGTAVFWGINNGTRFLDNSLPSEYSIQLAAARLILIGSLLIVVLYYRPEGILGEQDYDVTLPSAGGSTDGGLDD